MNSATLGKNPRRTGVPATKRGIPNPAYAEAVEGIPTLRRIEIAGEDLTVGGDARTGLRYVLKDNPLDRALKKRMISGAQHSALEKLRHHWYHSGLAPALASIDLDRIYSPESGNMSGMPKTEGQVFHRKRWREACDAMSYKIGTVITRIVCEEGSLEVAGAEIGYQSKDKAIAGAVIALRDGADILARLWGIG